MPIRENLGRGEATHQFGLRDLKREWRHYRCIARLVAPGAERNWGQEGTINCPLKGCLLVRFEWSWEDGHGLLVPVVHGYSGQGQSVDFRLFGPGYAYMDAADLRNLSLFASFWACHTKHGCHRCWIAFFTDSVRSYLFPPNIKLAGCGAVSIDCVIPIKHVL